MAKHIRIEPDCPLCGKELLIHSQAFDFTDRRPFGTRFKAWFVCGCGFETDRAESNNRASAVKKAYGSAKEYMPE